MAKKLWGGRFRKPIHPGFERFSSSLAVDCRLAPYDLEASKAHARGLARAGILSASAAAKIVRALDAIRRDLPALSKQFSRTDIEDIHSLIESELIRRIGEDAKRLHAGRSRNDQVNVATRLYCKDRLSVIEIQIARVQSALVHSAKRDKGIAVAGMTHLQKAMPVLWSHWLLCYVEALDRSREVIFDTRRRLDILTLGSGALAGSGLPIDREAVRKDLGFASVGPNSLDAVGSRDFVSESVYALAHLGVNLSRMAEDLLICQIEEIGLVDLPEELCTGSSMMPQKKNADFLELSRGAASLLTGNCVALLTLQKGLPSSYNRDLQWDKDPLFRSVELIESLLPIFEVLFKGIRIRPERAALTLVNDQLAATDLAEALVRSGLAFRDAHERVGQLVKEAELIGKSLRDVPEDRAVRILGGGVKDWKSILDPKLSVNRKRTAGSTRPSEVDRQIARWEKKLDAFFKFKNNELHAENVAVRKIVKQVGTPVYIYSIGTFLDHFMKIKRAFSSIDCLICFSVKSNSNLTVLKTLTKAGSGLDIVSGGELFKALKAGADPKKIVFASVGKTEEEIALAVRSGILSFNVESEDELEAINRVARRLNRKQNISLRINPDVQPKTHHYITTGSKGNKFGIDMDTAFRLYLEAFRYPYLNFNGVHLHIGSQITVSTPFVKALRRAADFVNRLRRAGVSIEVLNIGGGLGIVYSDEKPQTADDYAKAVLPILKKLGVRVILEPGRFISGNSGILATKVLYWKSSPHKTFAIVDAGMNDLIRPSIYGAHHDIVPVVQAKKKAKTSQGVDIVGPICESGDFLGKARQLPRLAQGDLLAVMSAGAYGYVMSSNYNSRPRVPEVVVHGSKFAVARKRETMADLVRGEAILDV